MDFGTTAWIPQFHNTNSQSSVPVPNATIPGFRYQVSQDFWCLLSGICSPMPFRFHFGTRFRFQNDWNLMHWYWNLKGLVLKFAENLSSKNQNFRFHRYFRYF